MAGAHASFASKSTRKISNYIGLKLREEDGLDYAFHWKSSCFMSEERNF